jgi:hypothetical protein
MITHGSSEPWREPPYFWSDMIQGRVQFLGRCDHDAQQTVVLEGGNGRSIGLVGDETGGLVGIFSIAFPRAIARGRLLLTHGSGIVEARDWAAGLLGVTA